MRKMQKSKMIRDNEKFRSLFSKYFELDFTDFLIEFKKSLEVLK